MTGRVLDEEFDTIDQFLREMDTPQELYRISDATGVRYVIVAEDENDASRMAVGLDAQLANTSFQTERIKQLRPHPYFSSLYSNVTVLRQAGVTVHWPNEDAVREAAKHFLRARSKDHLPVRKSILEAAIDYELPWRLD